MHFITKATALLALAASALAVDPDPNFDAITKPGLDEKVPAGETYTVEWIVPDTAPAGPVTISLLGGKDNLDLHPLGDLGKAENADLKFDWDVDSSLGAFATYGLQITLDSDPTKFQYSTPFQIVGGDGGNSTSPSATDSGSTSTSASGGSKSTSSGSETATKPATTTAKTTVEPSATVTSAPSGTTSAPATESTGAAAKGSGSGAVGLLGGLAIAVLAL